jgi:hypothetical protein
MNRPARRSTFGCSAERPACVASIAAFSASRRPASCSICAPSLSSVTAYATQAFKLGRRQRVGAMCLLAQSRTEAIAAGTGGRRTCAHRAANQGAYKADFARFGEIYNNATADGCCEQHGPTHASPTITAVRNYRSAADRCHGGISFDLAAAQFAGLPSRKRSNLERRARHPRLRPRAYSFKEPHFDQRLVRDVAPVGRYLDLLQ